MTFLRAALWMPAVIVAAAMTLVARPASAECYYGCGWGWGLVSAIAYDDYYDGDPWYDDGQFGAGEVALTIAAIELIARSANSGAYDRTTYGQPATVYHDTGTKAQIVAPATTYATQTVAAPVVSASVASAPVASAPLASGGYVGEGQLAACSRHVVDHREYRYCGGGVWYARQFLLNWGQVSQPAGVIMQ